MVRAATDAAFGDRVRIRPMQTAGTYSDGNPVVDPSRPASEAVGKLNFGIPGDQNLTGSNINQWMARSGTGDVTLHIDPDTYPQARLVVAGDRIECLDQPLKFQVLRVDRLSTTRLVLNLAQVTL